MEKNVAIHTLHDCMVYVTVATSTLETIHDSRSPAHSHALPATKTERKKETKK